MLTTLRGSDLQIEMQYLSPSDIEQALTIEDIERFLNSLGVFNIIRQADSLIAPTVCHNRLGTEASMKLYWYDNEKIFHCYTHCQSMSIFSMYQHFMDANGKHVYKSEAIDYVRQFLSHTPIEIDSMDYSYCLDMDKYIVDNQIVKLKPYNKNILSCFEPYYPPQWIKEGITPEVMKKFKIGFYMSQNEATIPHFDKDGDLVGVRARSFDEDELALGRKYIPVTVGDDIYKHQLSFNLYGIYENQAAIRKFKRAVIFESEKSVMKDRVFYGDNSVAVAVCGSNINKYQISLLTDYFGVNDICIALDKEYEKWDSPQGKAYRAKLMKICSKYDYCAEFSYIWDDTNLTQLKDAPNDKGKAIWEQLYKRRSKNYR